MNDTTPILRLRAAQTMVEYVIVLVVLVGVVLALGTLSGALRSNEARTLDLVSSEYP